MADDTETDALKAETPPSAAAPPQTPASRPPVPAGQGRFGRHGGGLRLHCMRASSTSTACLPPGTTADNLVERICVIGHHDDENADAGKKGVEDDEGDEVEGEGGYDGQASGGGGGNVEEGAQRPIAMSTLNRRRPAHAARCSSSGRTDYRSRCLKRIDKMSRCEVGDAPFLLAARPTSSWAPPSAPTSFRRRPRATCWNSGRTSSWPPIGRRTRVRPQAKKAMKPRAGLEARRPDEHDDAEARRRRPGTNWPNWRAPRRGCGGNDCPIGLLQLRRLVPMSATRTAGWTC